MRSSGGGSSSGRGQLPKLKHIESFLSDLENFEKGEFSKLGLEQHMTPPNVAALCISLVAENEEDMEDQVIGDFGCGTGMLSCGLLFLGAGQVIGLELDSKYAQVTLDTLEEKFEDPSMYDVINVNLKQWKPRRRIFDTVVMNPPFGTKDEGIDALFLDRAFSSCIGNVYSMHKSSTRKFIQKKGESAGYEFTMLQEIKFPLPKRFNKYHKKELAFTEVDFVLFTPTAARREQIQKEIDAEAMTLVQASTSISTSTSTDANLAQKTAVDVKDKPQDSGEKESEKSDS